VQWGANNIPVKVKVPVPVPVPAPGRRWALQRPGWFFQRPYPPTHPPQPFAIKEAPSIPAAPPSCKSPALGVQCPLGGRELPQTQLSHSVLVHRPPEGRRD